MNRAAGAETTCRMVRQTDAAGGIDPKIQLTGQRRKKNLESWRQGKSMTTLHESQIAATAALKASFRRLLRGSPPPFTKGRRQPGLGLVAVLAVTLCAGILPAVTAQAADVGSGRAGSLASERTHEEPSTRASGGDCGLAGLDDRCEAWTAPDPAERMVVSPKGNRLFAWSPPPSSGSAKFYARDTATGQLVWEATQAGITSATAGIRELTVSPDGNRVYAVSDDIASGATIDHDRDIIVTAYAASTGKPLWTRVLGLPAISRSDRYVSVDMARAITVSPDGRRVYVIGFTRLLDRIRVVGAPWVTNPAIVLAAYDRSTGNLLWNRIKGGKYSELHGLFLRVSPNSRKVYVGGAHATCGRGPVRCPQSFLLLAFLGHNPAAPSKEGKVLWDAVYDGFGGADQPVGMDLAPDGSKVFLTGWSGGPTWSTDWPDYDWATVAYSTATGAEVWVARYGGPKDDRPDPLNRTFEDGNTSPSSIVVSPKGDAVFVTGMFEAYPVMDTRAVVQERPVAQRHEVTVAYRATTGKRLWVAQFRTLDSSAAPVTGAHHAHPATLGASVTVAPDGSRVYVAGTAAGTDRDLLHQDVTVAYKAGTGQQSWIARVTRPPADLPPSQWVSVSPDGGTVLVARGNVIHAYEATP